MAKKDIVIILAEDDEGHTTLIMKNLKQAGFVNKLLHFGDGQETLDFLFQRGTGLKRERGTAYVLLLDIKMPRVDGIEVLRQMKKDRELCKIPVIILTTTDDPREVERCHSLGCSVYIVKPVDYDKFVDAIRRLGLFLLVVEMPKINGELKWI